MPKRKFILGKPRHRSWLSRSPLKLSALAVGLSLITIGLVFFFDSYVLTHGKTLSPGAETINTSDGPPSEDRPSQTVTDNYSVPADQPRSITISSVHAYGLIQKVGITKGGAMATPNNVFYGGWYVNSVQPGQTGLSIINGHVSGSYNGGIFRHLASVKVNDIIEVEFGDKSVRKFSVVERKQLSDSQSAAYLFTKRADITSQLNLITCGGRFDRSSQTFNDRVVVVAKAIES